MSKIFIVEDDENIRELIIYALNSNGFEAIGFECSSDFWCEIKNDTPLIVILDIMLPDEDGISILKRLKQEYKTLPIIMLTAKSSEYDKVKGLDLGADDYITKPFSVLELISRTRAVLRRSTNETSGNIIVFNSIAIDIERHIATADGNVLALTYKEFELLVYLLQNKDIVLSRDKIMEKVWGFDFEGESRTVDMHIKTLRQKLCDSGDLIKTIRGVGYKIGV